MNASDSNDPPSGQDWQEWEDKRREECAAILRDARDYLEERAASQRERIDKALSSFERDFEAWIERSRRGKGGSKPSLDALLDIWLERRGKGAASPEYEGETAELRRRLELALETAGQAQAGLAQARIELESLRSAASRMDKHSRARSKIRRAFAGVAVAASMFGLGMAAQPLIRTLRAPPSGAEIVGAALKDARRQAVVDAVATEAGDEVLSAVLARQADHAIGRAVAADPRQALAKLKEVAPDELAKEAAEFQPAKPAAEPTEASAPKDPSEELARLIDEAPEETARLLAAKAPAVAVAEALKAQPSLAMAPIAELPADEFAKLLQDNIQPPKLAELVKAVQPAAPPRPVAFRTFDNRDMGGGEGVKLGHMGLQACVAACRAKETCKAFSFDKWNRACYARSKAGELKVSARTVTGVREDVRPPKAVTGDIRMERYPSKAFPGPGYKSFLAEGLPACEEACGKEDACVAYTFRSDERQCRLYRSTGAYLGDDHAASGGKRQD